MRTFLSVIKRLLLKLPVIWLIATVIFFLIHLVPGDPVVLMLGDGASSGDIAALRHRYGLDAPLASQYLHYWWHLLHGDLGRSLRLHDSVLHLVLQRYPFTVALTAAATLLGVGLAVPAGIASARRAHQWPDKLIGFGSMAGLALPNFAIGPLLIVLLAIGLGWFPVSGSGNGFLDFLRHLVLPAITLGLGLAAVLTRMVRTSVLEELGQDYIRTARAKGLSHAAVFYRHALPNALNPVLTVLGLQFGSLLSGAIVTETIFSWPGLGRLTLSAVSNRDYALVQGCILAIGLTYVAVNFLTDALYVLTDPRMRS